jgi:hypothetical protein
VKLKCSECKRKKHMGVFCDSEKARILAGNKGRCGDCLRKYNTAARHRSTKPNGVGQGGGAWRGESNNRLFLPGSR